MSRSFPFSSIFFAFLVLDSFNHGVNCDLIGDACKYASRTDPDRYDSCVSSLSENPANKHDHDLNNILTGNKGNNIYYVELGVISRQTCLQKATSIHSYIAKILKYGKEEPAAAKQWLESCLELYSFAVGDVEKAIASFKMKYYFSANIEISAAMDSAVTCEDLFKEDFGQDLTSPLAKQDDEFYRLTEVSLGITCTFIGTCSSA
ncbi:hypothetical protein MKW92_041560 [Papaver armeniacum]|nr:hypothetical protein MKW92_041560 [Papaver armeniacum]